MAIWTPSKSTTLLVATILGSRIGSDAGQSVRSTHMTRNHNSVLDYVLVSNA